MGKRKDNMSVGGRKRKNGGYGEVRVTDGMAGREVRERNHERELIYTRMDGCVEGRE